MHGGSNLNTVKQAHIKEQNTPSSNVDEENLSDNETIRSSSEQNEIKSSDAIKSYKEKSETPTETYTKFNYVVNKSKFNSNLVNKELLHFAAGTSGINLK